jgi:hypothetical protein
MSTWFECKLRYQKINQEGKEQTVNELYLVDAVSFTDAEARINKEIEPYITGEFNVTNIKIANFSEILPNDAGDRWFKSKVSYITLDEKKGVERKTSSYMLVQANNVKDAYEQIEESMKGMTTDYSIPNIAESSIMDVFPYFSDEDELNEKIPENFKPVEGDDSDSNNSVD